MKKIELNLQRFAEGDIEGLLTKGTKLSYKDGATTVDVAAVKSIPAIGTDPEKIDVTHLGSEKKSYIKGLQDTDTMEFAIVYQGKNFKNVHALVEKGGSVEWIIEYPDGMKAEFTGEPSWKLDGAEVNQAIGFNLVVVVSKGPTVTPAP